MQHLTLETLARLVDEAPTPAERAHLESCAACRAELEALRTQTAALADLAPLAAPARAWPLLQARLQLEGLLRAAAPAARPGGRRAPLLRAAAYAGLFLAGGVAGLAVGRSGAAGAAAPAVAEADALPAARTPAEARQHLQQAEAAYLAALARYGEMAAPPQADADPAARLAALEGIVLSAGAALEAAPADPVINGYYLAAIGQREAVLRQIAQTARDPWF